MHLQRRVKAVNRLGNRVESIDVEDRHGTQERVTAPAFLSTMPLTELVRCMNPLPPAEVLEAADGLKYRDFLIVTLVLNHANPFPDNWIYLHSPDAQVGRIQNFRAWSADMFPNKDTASIGMEYFCHVGDWLWTTSDEDLLKLATRELAEPGLAPAESVIDGTVIRQPKVYPVYDDGYLERVETLRD